MIEVAAAIAAGSPQSLTVHWRRASAIGSKGSGCAVAIEATIARLAFTLTSN